MAERRINQLAVASIQVSKLRTRFCQRHGRRIYLGPMQLECDSATLYPRGSVVPSRFSDHQ